MTGTHIDYEDQYLLGRAGEAGAAAWYEEQGYVLLAMRQRCRAGEIDLVMEAPDGEIVFIEVKARRSLVFGAAEAVTSKKLDTMRRCAAEWLSKHAGIEYRPIRFDVVEAIFNGSEFLYRRFVGVEDGAC